MEEEALRNYCIRMISIASNKQQQLEEQEEERGREKTGTTGQVLAGLRGQGEFHVPFSDGTNRGRNRTSPMLMSQGPEAQPAPLQLITMLRLKAFKEKMRRVRRYTSVTHFYHLLSVGKKKCRLFLRLTCFCAVAGCRGGAPWSCCLWWVWAETGCSGLENFYQEEEDTTAVPNTEGQTKHSHELWSKWLYGQTVSILLSYIYFSLTDQMLRLPNQMTPFLSYRSQIQEQNTPKPSDAPQWIWEELLDGNMQVIATCGCCSNDLGTWVVLATDEMRGHSDKNTNYRNSFSKTLLSFFRQIAADMTGTVLTQWTGPKHVPAALFAHTDWAQWRVCWWLCKLEISLHGCMLPPASQVTVYIHVCPDSYL